MNKTTYAIIPTCGHEPLTYSRLILAKAHAQAHADRSGCEVHIEAYTDTTRRYVCTQYPKVYGPYLPCESGPGFTVTR